MTVLFFIVSLVASILGAISGIGGGVIIKPVLDAVSGLSIDKISFLSGCTVLSMSVISIFNNRKQAASLIRDKKSKALVLGAVLGGIAGKWVFDLFVKVLFNERTVGIMQSLTLILLVIIIILYNMKKDSITTKKIESVIILTVIGLIMGTLSAFLGIGGGPINIVIITYFLSLDSKATAVYSIFIILFSQLASLLLTIASGSVPEVSLNYLLVMIIGGVVGGAVGSRIAKKISNRQTDRVFGVILVIILAISCYNLFGFINSSSY